MDKTFTLPFIEEQADSELHELLARAYTVRQHSSEDINIDYSFTIILIGFLVSVDPVSRWFQKYTEATQIQEDAIFSAKSTKREDIKQAAPSTVLLGQRGRFTASARDIFSEAIRFGQQTTGKTEQPPKLGTRHLMAAYIYGPGTHEMQLKNYGFDRVHWSNSFLRFVRQQYPQDNFNAWQDIHRFQFSTDPELDSETDSVPGTQLATVSEKVNVHNAPNPNSTVVGSMSPGEPYRIVGQSENWYQIDFKGQPGFVTAQFVTVSSAVTPKYRAQRLWNDAAEGEDLLDVTNEAYALAELLLLRDFDPPVCAGIFGGWGSGKSFFMNLIYERMVYLRGQAIEHDPWSLEATKFYPQVGHVYLIRFDAWTYAKSNLWISLVQTLFLELNRQLSIEGHLSTVNDKTGVSRNYLKTGEFWEELFLLSQEDVAKATTDDLLNQVVVSWQKRPGGSADDILWRTLNIVQEARIASKKAALKESQNKLDQTRLELVTAKSNLEDFDRRGDAAIDNEALFKTVADKLKLGDTLRQVSTHVRQALKEAHEPIDFVQSLGLLLHEFSAHPRRIWVFIVIIVVALFVVVGGTVLVEEAPRQIVTIVTLLFSGIATFINFKSVAIPVFQLIEKWNKEATELYQNYQENQSQLRNNKKAELQNAVTDLQQEVAKQQAETALVQQQGELSLRFDSATDFIALRSKKLLDTDLGILNEFQRDLLELTEVFAQGDSREDAVRDKFREKFPRGPVRVVLFIDDLDRCPPEKVVEVLEATQLLLKTKLFVVVLALDIRYVSRALEKQYDQILTRNGSPSGLDYIEKIIQIPYHIRPISAESVHQYLSAQIEVERVVTTNTSSPVPHASQRTGIDTPVATTSQSDEKQHTPEKVAPPHFEVIKFSQVDFDIIQSCCQQIDMVPRAIKRLINVSKLLKLIWSRSPISNYEDVFKTAVFLIACSERYPRLMLGIFEELISKSRTRGQAQPALHKILMEYTPEHLRTRHQIRQWDELKNIVQTSGLLSKSLTLEGMSLKNLNLVRSFSFLGDVVDDQDDGGYSQHPDVLSTRGENEQDQKKTEARPTAENRGT
jgi:hypothetical protein